MLLNFIEGIRGIQGMAQSKTQQSPSRYVCVSFGPQEVLLKLIVRYLIIFLWEIVSGDAPEDLETGKSQKLFT